MSDDSKLGSVVGAIGTTAAVGAAVVGTTMVCAAYQGKVRYEGWYRSSDQKLVGGIFAAISHRTGLNLTFLRFLGVYYLFGVLLGAYGPGIIMLTTYALICMKVKQVVPTIDPVEPVEPVLSENQISINKSIERHERKKMRKQPKVK
jgi:phage shock protein PspC (stress-responsive transcriptional regulator)